jgi:hypothetical protein
MTTIITSESTKSLIIPLINKMDVCKIKRFKRHIRCSDDWFYNTKCIESTKRQKTRGSKNKFLEKQLYDKNIEWEKETTIWKNDNIINYMNQCKNDEYYMNDQSIKTCKNTPLSEYKEYKQNNIKRNRKSSIQNLRQSITTDNY